MRLDGITGPNINTGGIPQKTTAPGKEISLSEGDVVTVKVLSVKDGTASLKTADGTVFQAQLEDGVDLPPGSNVRLMVTQQAGETITMALATPGQTAASSAAAEQDPVTNLIMRQLANMGFKADGETVAIMRGIMEQFPDMPVNQAAFMAANKLPAEPSVVSAMQSVFSGEADTGSMLEALVKLATAVDGAAVPSAEAAVQGQGAAAEGQNTVTADGQNEPLTSRPAGEQGAVASTAQGTEKGVAGYEQAVKGDAAPEGQLPVAARRTAEGGAEAAGQSGGKLPEFGEWLARALSTPRGGALPSAGELAKSPLLDGLSSRSLAGMAESLADIAQSMPELDSESKLFDSIAKFAKKLFLESEDASPEIAGKLKAAGEELYVKLAYFRDAVAMSSAGAKTAVLEQTQKLMDHVRLLNGLDQFVCLQLPVQFGDERRNAELYFYKKEKRGSKKIDPEDVKILLALDLEHMGHIESFIEIRGREVSLRFEVESDDIADTFRQHTTNLHDLLDESGYKFTNSTFITKSDTTTVESALLKLIDFENSINAGLDFLV